MRGLLAVLGTAFLAASASAATLKVPQQYGTIQEAVDAASDGDTVVVSKGVYFESVVVEAPNLRILGKKAVVDGTFAGRDLSVRGDAMGDYTCFDVLASGTTIQGFTLRNGFIHVNVAAPGCRVLKCVSRNAAYAGVLSAMAGGTEISGCRLLASGYAGIVVQGSSGAVTVSRNEVRQAGYLGIQVEGSGAVVLGNTVGTKYGEAPGILVSGAGVVVEGNRVSNADGAGIVVMGPAPVVTGNRVNWVAGGAGISVSGDGAVVQRNTVAVAGVLLEAFGSGSRILDNRLSAGIGSPGDDLLGGPLFKGPDCAGAVVVGDGNSVAGNLVQQVAGGGYGFFLYGYGSGGGTITGNTAEDVAGAGFTFMSLRGATMDGCRAVRCGAAGYSAGFAVLDSEMDFTDCSAEECHGDGFYVSGIGNAFTACSATGSTFNGFRVYGEGNVFTSCSARGSDGQGFHNGGTGTVLAGGVYIDNRLDIANDTFDMATFSGGLGGVLYESGGETTDPEVWYEGFP